MTEAYWTGVWRRRLARRRFLAGGLSGVTSLVALACTPTSPPAPTPGGPAAAAVSSPTAAPAASSTPPPPTAKLGGVARFIATTTGDYPNLDPHQLTTSVFYGNGHGLAYSRLVKPSAGPDRKGDEVLIVGDAAERWEQADDRTYLFKIRPGLKFQNVAPLNGRALVAEDIRYSFERQKALGVTASFLPRFDKVEVVDPQTLRITLPAPDADFLIALADVRNVIIGKEAVDLKGDLKEGPTVGSGAWLLESYTKDSVARLKKNPDWYVKGVPYVDALEFLRLTDNATRAGAFRAQEVATSFGMGRADLENLKKTNPQLTITTSKRIGNGLTLGVNETRPPFTDPRARRALALALDVKQIQDTAFSGDGWNYTTLALPGLDWNLPDEEYTSKWFKRDVNGAKQMLAAAGAPSPFELEIVHLNLDPTWDAAAELALAQLKEAGVNARLKIVDLPTWNAFQSGQSEVLAYHGPPQPQSTVTADLRIRFRTGGSRNPSKISDPKLDAMIDQQSTMVRDPDARKKLIMDIQRYLMEQGHLIPVWGSVTVGGRWGWLQDFRDQGQPSNDPEPFNYLWLDK
jgi:ABC-type transport system substrate-binding protein